VGNNPGGALGTLSTDATGTTTITAAANVVNAAVLDFNDDVVLGTSVVMTGTASVDFTRTVNSSGGARNLTVNSIGVTSFNAAVGDVGILASLTTNGATAINAAPGANNGTSIRTVGAQIYNGAVTLGHDNVVLTSTNDDLVQFSGTVDSSGSARNLTVNTGGTTGVTRFNGVVGNTGQLASLTTNAGGTTEINAAPGSNGSSIRTTVAQTYNDAVTLGNTTVLTSTTQNTGSVTFTNTSTLTANTNPFAISADVIEFNGGPNSIRGGGSTLTLLPHPSTSTIVLGGSGAGGPLNLSDADLAALDGGFSQVQFGTLR
jgi:hypothetical protein